jgi:hypothetical protein
MKKWIGFVLLVAAICSCAEEETIQDSLSETDLEGLREKLVETDQSIDHLESTIRYNDSLIKILTLDTITLDMTADTLLSD